MVGCLSGYSQESILDKKINISKQDVSIAYFFDLLEKETGVTIAYSDDAIDIFKIVSINFEEKPLHQILRSVFPSQSYKFKVLGQKLLIYKRPNRYTLNGYISEKGSDEYLPGASIYIPELNVGTITNDYGFYSITLAEGNHTVLFSFEGYKKVEKKINLLENFDLNLSLDIETQHLEEVLVNSDNETKQSNITQISSERLKSSVFQDIPVVLGEKDVLKTLQLLPGIQSGNEGSAGFYVRGGTPDQNLVVLDEATVYNSNHLFGIFSIFNGDAIRSVNIFKGGFPARFGGRLSSVIKIDTKNGNKEKFNGKATIGLISSSFLLEGPIKKSVSSFVLSGRRTYADLVSLPFQNGRDKIIYYFTDVNAKYHHVFNDKNKLYWSTYFGQDKFRNKSIGVTLQGEEIESTQKIEWGNITSTLRWNHEFSDQLFSNTSLIFSNYKFAVNSESNTLATSANSAEAFSNTSSGINDYGIKSDFSYFPNPRHQIKFGLASTYHNFTPKEIRISNSAADIITNKQEIKTLESGLYIEDDWKVSNKISINPGIRLSHFQHRNSGYFRPEIRLSGAYRPYPLFSIKASYVKMNQYIHRLSNTGLGLPTDLWISSTDKLKPQVSEQVTLGLAKDFDNNGYTVTIEGYYKKLNDVISLKEGASFLGGSGVIEDIVTSFETVDFENGITTGQGWAYGSEFLIRKKRGKFTGWLGYTLSWSERQFDELNGGKKFKERYDRRHDFSLVGIYKPSKKITISSSWVFSTGINYNITNILGVSATDDFPIDTDPFGSDFSMFNVDKNNFRGESFHKLDLGIQFHKITKRNRERTWGISIYNVYARKNPFYYETSIAENSPNIRNSLFKRYFLQLIPSFNYTLKF